MPYQQQRNIYNTGIFAENLTSRNAAGQSLITGMGRSIAPVVARTSHARLAPSGVHPMIQRMSATNSHDVS